MTALESSCPRRASRWTPDRSWRKPPRHRSGRECPRESLCRTRHRHERCAAAAGARAWVTSAAVLALLLQPAAVPAQPGADSGGPVSAERPPGDRTLVVGIARDHPPYSFVDERGRPRGLAVDLIESVGSVMELELVLRTGTTAELRRALERGEVDILPDMPLSLGLEGRVAFSLPHTDVEDGVFVRTDTEPLPEGGGSALLAWLEGRTLVTLEGDPSLDFLDLDGPAPDGPAADRPNGAPEAGNVLVEPSAADVLRRLASGEGDAAILPAATGLLLIEELGLSNLQILPFEVGIYSRGLSFAVRPGADDLLARLDEGLVIVTSTRRYLEIYNRWQQYRGGAFVSGRQLLWILLPGLALLALSAAWTFTLRRTVTRRTRELEQEMAERRRLEAQVQEARKLESLGVLAGGIAHDFNNLLTGMLGNASLAKSLLRAADEKEPERATLRTSAPPTAPRATRATRALASGRGAIAATSIPRAASSAASLSRPVAAKVCERLEQIEKAGRRASDLIRQMLAFSGKGGFVSRPMELSELVRRNRSLLRSAVPETIRIEAVEDEGPTRVRADPAQLAQLLVQLVTNGAEAIQQRLALDGGPGTGNGDSEPVELAGRGEAGTIVIRTGSRYCDRGELERIYLGEPLESGSYAFLEVEDDGVGMAPEVLERIFEPFFSTKFTGRGLGLAAALGIVRGHGGAITVDSEPETGSRFRVYLPSAAPADPPDAPGSAAKAVPRQAFAAGAEHDRAEPARVRWTDPGPVLVVDDEALVRGVVAATLAGAGYRVVEAADGEEAIEVFRQDPDIRVVILDAALPRLDGAQTYERLRRLRPEVRVVITSGYDQEPTRARLPGAQLSGFLRKPHREAALLEAVARAAAATEAARRPSSTAPSPEISDP